MKSGNLKVLEPSGPLQACNGTAVPFYSDPRYGVEKLLTDTRNKTHSYTVQTCRKKGSHIFAKKKEREIEEMRKINTRTCNVRATDDTFVCVKRR
jgi:hypothetical protein